MVNVNDVVVDSLLIGAPLVAPFFPDGDSYVISLSVDSDHVARSEKSFGLSFTSVSRSERRLTDVLFTER